MTFQAPSGADKTLFKTAFHAPKRIGLCRHTFYVRQDIIGPIALSNNLAIFLEIRTNRESDGQQTK